MSKFGLEPESDEESVAAQEFARRIAAFPPVSPRTKIDLAAVDAAAAPHGFVSREASPPMPPAATAFRRRRIGVPEPTRHLAIRLTVTQYERFVAYADEHQLTYQDALSKLLTDSGR